MDECSSKLFKSYQFFEVINLSVNNGGYGAPDAVANVGFEMSSKLTVYLNAHTNVF